MQGFSSVSRIASPELVDGEAELTRDLVDGRLSSQVVRERVRAALDAMDGQRAPRWDVHGTLFLMRMDHCLANPPHGVRDEAEAPRLIESLGCADEPQVAFADQVHQRDFLVPVAFRD